MSEQAVSEQLQRLATVLNRQPDAALHDDTPASARWTGGLRTEVRHARGCRILTDLPQALGGTGAEVTPGWLFRAGVATCATSCIALVAAEGRIALDALEITVQSRSDSRGLLGMADEDGRPVYAGPDDIELHVRIGAAGLSSEALRQLVHEGMRRSPIPNAVLHATPMALHVAVIAD